MATRFKRMTVNRLHATLGKLIAKGSGKRQVCINKDTFRDNRESDGVVILPVDGVRLECIDLADDDGGVKTNYRGEEVSRWTAVLYSESGTGYRSILSPESIDRYVREIEWPADASDDARALATNQIREFARFVKTMTS